MTVGINSYVTLEEANALVSAFYGGTDIETAWDEKTDAVKEVFLISACADIDALPYPGRPRAIRQNLAFPRWPHDEVPQQIKRAQVEVALLPLNPDVTKVTTAATKRLTLQKQGVTSFSIGDLSESYGRADALLTDFPFMASNTVAQLLRPFLGGGYAIC